MIAMSQVCGTVAHSFVDLLIDAAHLMVCERTLQSLTRHKNIYPYLCELQQWFDGGSSRLCIEWSSDLTSKFCIF